MLAGLASRGLRGVAFDLPGLGLADRPADFDYAWTGLGRFCVAVPRKRASAATAPCSRGAASTSASPLTCSIHIASPTMSVPIADLDGDATPPAASRPLARFTNDDPVHAPTQMQVSAP